MRFKELKIFKEESNIDYANLINFFNTVGFKSSQPKPSRMTKTKHIRVGASTEKISDFLKKNGALVAINPSPNNLSSTYDQIQVEFPKNFKDKLLAGKRFEIASALKQGRSIGIKVFTPTNLGLSGKTFDRNTLYTQIKSKIPSMVQDENLLEFFMQALDVAIGKKQNIDLDIMSSINDHDLRQLGIDFGEVLGPLMAGQNNITYAAGNSMLADVEINGKLISIKSASGSGTSFKAIVPYLDQLKTDKSIKLNQEEKQVEKFFRAFTDTKGDNIDKIIAGSHEAQTAEHQAMVKIVGDKNFTKKDLENFANKFKKNQYSEFLKTIYPIAIAGGYKNKADVDRPNGLPADANYYLGKTKKIPKAKQAGKPFWTAKGPGEAGRNILVYILATSFLKDAKKVGKKEKISKFLSKTMSKVNAELMWVNINKNGSLTLQTKPIKDVQIDFQYHAPSHIPGNNLPGFSLKL